MRTHLGDGCASAQVQKKRQNVHALGQQTFGLTYTCAHQMIGVQRCQNSCTCSNPVVNTINRDADTDAHARTRWLVRRLSTCFLNRACQNSLQMNLMISSVSPSRGLSLVYLRSAVRGISLRSIQICYFLFCSPFS